MLFRSTRSSGGAGLGLALCDEIARLHHTRLEIESELNTGTSVSLLFPAVREHDSERENDIDCDPEELSREDRLLSDRSDISDGSERGDAADD